jgi:hypothetical protein
MMSYGDKEWAGWVLDKEEECDAHVKKAFEHGASLAQVQDALWCTCLTAIYRNQYLRYCQVGPGIRFSHFWLMTSIGVDFLHQHVLCWLIGSDARKVH